MAGKLRIGSRESALAVAQARLFMQALAAANPGVELELVTMKTTGDKLLDQPLQRIGGKGVFVKELEQALLEFRVDYCVHSLKDMAVEENPLLPLLAVGEREDPRDVLVLPPGAQAPVEGLAIGCSSLRRTLQLAKLYPGCRVEPVRGNVLTRLDKLDRGEYGALVLAAAGLKRLGLEHRISRIFQPEELLPACGQGILGVQGRAGEDIAPLRGFHCARAWAMAQAERAFIRVLGGGCTSPVTAHACIQGDDLVITGYALDKSGQPLPGSIRGPLGDAAALGERLGKQLKQEADA